MDTKQQLVNALAGLGSTITEAMDVIEGFVPCGHPALTVSNALVALDTDDDAALAQQLETVEGFIDHVSENRGVPAYHDIEVELAGPKADLLAAIREVGALMQTAGVKNTQVNEWVYRSLAALNSSDEKAAEQLAESPVIKAALAQKGLHPDGCGAARMQAIYSIENANAGTPLRCPGCRRSLSRCAAVTTSAE